MKLTWRDGLATIVLRPSALYVYPGGEAWSRTRGGIIPWGQVDPLVRSASEAGSAAGYAVGEGVAGSTLRAPE